MSEGTERYLASLTAESEFFALVGRGHKNSFYKVFVRRGEAEPWWSFERDAHPSPFDPIDRQSNLPVAQRAVAVWAPLPHLVSFAHRPSEAIARLFERARSLGEPERGGSQLVSKSAVRTREVDQ